MKRTGYIVKSTGKTFNKFIGQITDGLSKPSRKRKNPTVRQPGRNSQTLPPTIGQQPGLYQKNPAQLSRRSP